MAYNELRKELGTNFIEYATAVNTDRAIPDAKSGLKPVARRILFGAHKGNYSSRKPHEKCARLVGDVMGNLHPHGDSSIYEAMVRLSQPWVMRYPLLDFHGNMGNIGGDGPAASRYTNIRLARISEDGMLSGLKKRNVDFMPDYDEKDEEPVTLPAIFPNLLCNPNTGIGVAMACEWLPHNLSEVALAINDYLDGKEPTLLAPDFPTGGLIINGNDLPAIIKKGNGTVKVRGQYKVEGQNLVFYEIPYGKKTEEIISKIGKLADEKKIDGIVDIRDESNKKGIRIVIQCARTVSPETMARHLFANKSDLQASIHYNQVALVDKTPKELGLVDCIQIYVDHNIDCIKRESQYDLEKAEKRVEIIDGLLIALEDIDNVITLIKQSESSTHAKARLIEKYNLTENQAKAILDMKLAKLAKLEKLELENEKKELMDKIAKLKLLLIDRNAQVKELKLRLSNIVKSYGDARRTQVTHLSIGKQEKEIETVTPEECVVTVTCSGEVKRITTKSFRVQKRNGKGAKSEDSAMLSVIKTNTIDNLLVFTDSGKMFRVLVDDIPVGTNASRGVNLNTLIPTLDGKVIAVTSLDRDSDYKYVVFITEQGLIKKTLLSEYKGIKRKTGTIAIKIKDGDTIVNVEFMNEENLVLVTRDGQSIHFETKCINPIGRNSCGVKSIKLAAGDKVVKGIPIRDSKSLITVFTENGYGKKVSIQELPIQGRTGKGVFLIKPNENSGKVADACALTSADENVLIIGTGNTICVSEEEIPLLTRLGIGNLMIKSKIKKVVKL